MYPPKREGLAAEPNQDKGGPPEVSSDHEELLQHTQPDGVLECIPRWRKGDRASNIAQLILVWLTHPLLPLLRRRALSAPKVVPNELKVVPNEYALWVGKGTLYPSPPSTSMPPSVPRVQVSPPYPPTDLTSSPLLILLAFLVALDESEILCRWPSVLILNR